MLPAQHQQFSGQISQHLTQHPWWASAPQVFTYVSIQGEPDLEPLRAQYPEKIWGLPRRRGQALTWHRWQVGTPLTQGTLPEPLPDALVLTPQPGDLLLMPALAYDQRGYRLGYGAGYFDRLLAQPEWQAVYRVGIIFQEFLLPVLPREPWDQAVQAVCTEQGWWTITPPG
ncbi:5-formyltetrahydrofolate cyclo-ligase [Gloeomargarita lithophora Alchichica-D10]|uniref:5-formyltetrahydrofolate cyclo-ligase n=1 Tax=Gloeomargarita lithophora Alchichica-D10 TaxID=1188229 RepID=A0A1J0AGD7_9CYAN|nr:5-formyltetrahydrofolate cyclo-ligase [Gloeomargarita lithophora]APB34989.1 5-formyltetrahydrofolate cyclo-ligase [Gloeomargarita lithophora Alchichica-D10]